MKKEKPSETTCYLLEGGFFLSGYLRQMEGLGIFSWIILLGFACLRGKAKPFDEDTKTPVGKGIFV